MRYQCPNCGYIYDEEKEGAPLRSMKNCPVCGLSTASFIPIDENGNEITDFEEKVEVNVKETKKTSDDKKEENSNPMLSFPEEYEKNEPGIRYMDLIHDLSEYPVSVISAMATDFPMPSWDDILILGNQLNPLPLDEDAPVKTTTIIGPNAKKPLVIENPAFVSHMSFGAISEEAKEALAKGSADAKTAMCSGEGGVLPQIKDKSYKYIFEYVPNQYSVTEENLKTSDAIEIKIGQATKPGMGGLLPASKVTEQIAKIRDKPVGEDILSPATFPNIQSREDLKNVVDELKDKSGGRPIGVKIAANRIEEDLEFISYSGCDYITIDGRGGATGASPKLMRDSTSVPTIYALHRSRKYMDEHGMDQSLVITGGLRVSTDIAKALAMGADAVALATASLMSIGCQQYRACSSGTCPVGIATQDPKLRKRFKVDIGAKRLTNFFNVTLEELKSLARITGHDNIHDLNISDIATFNENISNYTDIKHM